MLRRPRSRREPLGRAAGDRGALQGARRSDPVRIFRLIAAQPEAICVCHITDRFDVSQPTISHHLKVLREAGLITVSRRGVWAYYASIRLLEDCPRLRVAVEQLAPEELVGRATERSSLYCVET